MASKIFAPCLLCMRLAKWIPVLFITAIIVWSYYAYVIELNFLTIDSIVKKVIYLLIYHLLLFMFLWSYWQTVFTESGKVPKQFRLPAAELELYMTAEAEELRRETLDIFCQRQLLPVTNRTLTGDIRYCDKCCHVKPDRCHHCSVCGECILRMDHHCPWVNNCVSFTNYKFFVLFLGYAFFYCVFIATTTLEYFIRFWAHEIQNVNNKFHILFLFFVSMMFGVCLLCLFGYHIFLVSKNRSTIESFRAPIFWVNRTWVHDKEGFSLGTYNNFIEIFGDRKSYWFLPIFTSGGDGVTFPLKSHLIPSSLPSSSSPSSNPAASYGSTNTSLGDGISYPQRCVDEDTDGLLASRQRWSDEEEMNGGHCQQLTEVVVQPNHTYQV